MGARAEEFLAWLASQGASFWVWLPVTAIAGYVAKAATSYALELLRERRMTMAEQRRAASEFVYVADKFRRYWSRKFYDDQNHLPDPEPTSSVEWSGDPFDPLLTPERHALYSRLSPTLRNEAYALDHRVKEAKEMIEAFAEYDEDQIDYNAPVFVSEIAIASDQLYSSVLREAGLSRPEEHDTISDVKGHLESFRKARDEYDAKRTRWSDAVLAQWQEKAER